MNIKSKMLIHIFFYLDQYFFVNFDKLKEKTEAKKELIADSMTFYLLMPKRRI